MKLIQPFSIEVSNHCSFSTYLSTLLQLLLTHFKQNGLETLEMAGGASVPSVSPKPSESAIIPALGIVVRRVSAAPHCTRESKRGPKESLPAKASDPSRG